MLWISWFPSPYLVCLPPYSYLAYSPSPSILALFLLYEYFQFLLSLVELTLITINLTKTLKKHLSSSTCITRILLFSIQWTLRVVSNELRSNPSTKVSDPKSRNSGSPITQDNDQVSRSHSNYSSSLLGETIHFGRFPLSSGTFSIFLYLSLTCFWLLDRSTGTMYIRISPKCNKNNFYNSFTNYSIAHCFALR